LVDEHSLTQLAGPDNVAWQVPWSELHNLRLVQSLVGTTLIADADNRRFVWRTWRRREFSTVAPYVQASGGWVQRMPQPWTIVAVAFVTVLSFVGYFGALSHRSSGSATAKRLAAININFTDLPGSWTTGVASVLGEVVGPPGTVVTNFSTTTTAPSSTSLYEQVVSSFQHCMGVSNARDRMYGAAGQLPSVAVASKVFTSTVDSGVQVASYAQYYPSTRSVAKDTKEMTSPKFGACFADANANFIEAGALSRPATVNTGVALSVATFARGFRVAGDTTLTGVSFGGGLEQQQRLLVAVATRGHYEVTIFELCATWPQPLSLFRGLVNNVVSRLAPSTGAVV
jgi:hypothetical protein